MYRAVVHPAGVISPVELSPHPGSASRTLFSETQIQSDLDRPEADQQQDGGWTVDYLHWCAAQALEWRGMATVWALGVLRGNGRSAS